MGDFLNSILAPLEYVVAWLMVAFHTLLSGLGMPEDSGWTWALSIVGLVIVIRILLIPLFVKQIKASRGLQLIQPEMKKIQEKYKGRTDQDSRQAMTQETMELYRNTGTNPFSSCLPILLQSPVFFALFRVLNGIHDVARGKKGAIGPLDQALATQADNATLFGAPLSDTFMGANTVSTQILTVVLIILMSVSTFTSQWQLMMKNMPAAALDNPFAQQQKIMLYVLPVVFAVSGVNFPIGVLLYWLTTNVWSMGQQFYVIRNNPTPGSAAEASFIARKTEKAARKGLTIDGRTLEQARLDAEAEAEAIAEEKRNRQRTQPKRKKRNKSATNAGPADAQKSPSDDESDPPGIETT